MTHEDDDSVKGERDDRRLHTMAPERGSPEGHNGWCARVYDRTMKKLGMTLYHRPTHQTSMSIHPHHVNVSQGLFTDLTMVGVLYKLDALFLQRALILQTSESFWIPCAIYIALYDAWEVRPLLDAQFRNLGSNIYSHMVFLAFWMLIALMGTTFATESSGVSLAQVLECAENATHENAHLEQADPRTVPSQYQGTWSWYEAELFCAFKATHSLLRVVCYLETHLLGKSLKARNAALPRLIMYSLGSLPLIAAPIMVAARVSLDIVVIMFPVSFLIQKSIGHLIAYFDFAGIATRGSEARINMPFFLHRLREWTELQLGACILGLIAFSINGTPGAPERLHLGVMVAGYVCVAALDMLSYTTHPPNFRSHALVRGGLAQFIWVDGFAFTGLGLLGLAVGLRYALLSPVFDLCTGTENAHLLWLLSIGALVAVLALLFQQMVHATASVIKKRFWVLKFALALTILISPLIMMTTENVLENINIALYMLLNIVLAVIAILVVHAAAGGFRHKIKKKARLSFMGYALAAVIARQWLARTRRRLEERKNQMAISHSSRVAPKSESVNDRPVPEQVIELEEDDLDDPHGSPTAAMASHSSQDQSQPKLVHIFVQTLNDLFYSKPHVLTEHDVFAEYKLSWSDLFLDIIYVGAVFRMGDYLVAALGLGHDPPEDKHQPGAVYLFGAIFLAVFSCWWSKLAYTAKCGVSDVFHKLVDIVQGFLVFVMASSMTSPQEMDAKDAWSFTFAIALLLFHLIMLCLWIELGRATKRAWVKDMAKRNVSLTLLAIAGALSGIICIAMSAPWSLTSFFLSGTWLFPLLFQVVAVLVARDDRAVIEDLRSELLGYVQHRIGDLSLLWLGEGVIQVVRSQNLSTADEYSYWVFAFAFLNLSLCRAVIFKLGLFGHSELGKHMTAVVVGRSSHENPATKRDQLTLLFLYFLRSISGPAIVAMGIGLKKMVGITNELDGDPMKNCDVFLKKHVYELFCGSAVLIHFLVCSIYHLHRWAYNDWTNFAWMRFFTGTIVISLLFLVLTWIDCVFPLGVLIYTAGIWTLSLAYHNWTEDFLRSDEHHHDTGSKRAMFSSMTSFKTANESEKAAAYKLMSSAVLLAAKYEKRSSSTRQINRQAHEHVQNEEPSENVLAEMTELVCDDDIDEENQTTESDGVHTQLDENCEHQKDEQGTTDDLTTV